jgi:hypothetical protein
MGTSTYTIKSTSIVHVHAPVPVLLGTTLVSYNGLTRVCSVLFCSRVEGSILSSPGLKFRDYCDLFTRVIITIIVVIAIIILSYRGKEMQRKPGKA